jgi:hypothetical protein
VARKKSKPEGQDVDLMTEPGAAKLADPLTPASDPDAPSLAPEGDIDLRMASPGPAPATAPVPSPPTAVPMPATETLLLPLEERIRRLEAVVTHLGELQGLEQRVAERVATQMQREPPAPAGPTVLASAAALMDAGRQLLPDIHRSAGPTNVVTTVPRPAFGGKIAFLGEVLTELQAIYYMYVDPRYRLSWLGRVVPVVLLGLFFTTGWWVKYGTCGLGAIPIVGEVLLVRVIELVLCYLLFKIVGLEARRYRETAPDLPAHLRP